MLPLAEEGLFGKACRMLTSSGIADNNEETWKLLKTKHPYVPIPSPPTSVPSQSSVDLLPSDLNILAVLLSFPKDTSCGPSGLQVQHLLGASEASLPTSLLSALKAVVNILASGRALPEIAEYLAGATVIALKKPMGNDIRPIAVGEVLRQLTSKCLCAVVKYKASEYFSPYQYGVVCPSGVEKIIHSLRSCINDHWFDEDFTVAKVDLRNAFNLVSRNAVLENCAEFFPELFPWTSTLVLWSTSKAVASYGHAPLSYWCSTGRSTWTTLNFTCAASTDPEDCGGSPVWRFTIQ